ncbi:ATP-dependent nuclease [Amphibacillus jilinensis]|uniref:ATP-dependent nuclease n=1 Tax=Amphibacillus jilinensis TaxID=1216008 RepID=UPI00031791A1|nr:AAA family ATPase [Amphibacillus jilinensis]
MKISNLIIKNYRNIKDINIKLSNIVSFIGENNSGKSNVLRAITLPFLSNEVGYNNKNLSWFDINNEVKDQYYKFILENQKDILNECLAIEDFSEVIPTVTVEVHFQVKDTELYFVKDLATGINQDGNINYGISYNFSPKNVKDVLERVKEILISYENGSNLDESSIETIKMNLLPIDLYSHTIEVPGKNLSVSYDSLKLFKYTSLVAERDDFSQSSEKLGSKSLVKLLEMKLDTSSKITVEKEYTKFFEKLKGLSDMENIINWQENSKIDNAKDFFEKISILPNMPNMSSLLNSIRLGYSGEHLASQGLGYRNLILLLVLLNSFVEKKTDTAFSIITLEEPEAHLCSNNQKLMASYMNYFANKDNSVQLFYSTHSTEFVNKLDFNNIIIVNDGNAFSLSTELDDDNKDYLSKNPNLDLYKLFFSKKCILVEGLTEELLIRAYFNSKEELNDIEVISFHKGFKNIMDIWLRINQNTDNRLGIIRDYDDQPKARDDHHKYNEYENIQVKTTSEYTLEPEIVTTDNNYDLLNDYFHRLYDWNCTTPEELSDKWRNAKSSVMLRLCKDIADQNLIKLKMPKHIQDVIDFLSKDQKKQNEETSDSQEVADNEN